jgi:hypothetical protein
MVGLLGMLGTLMYPDPVTLGLQTSSSGAAILTEAGPALATESGSTLETENGP